MGRFARVAVVDVPHHITQRGNARQVILGWRSRLCVRSQPGEQADARCRSRYGPGGDHICCL